MSVFSMWYVHFEYNLRIFSETIVGFSGYVRYFLIFSLVSRRFMYYSLNSANEASVLPRR